MIKQEELSVILKRLTAVYPNYPVTKDLIEDWIIAFEDMNYSSMVNGLVRCLREHDTGYFPSPAEFRKFCFTDRSKSAWTDKKEDMIEEPKKKRIPMPEEFKAMLAKYLKKTSVKT